MALLIIIVSLAFFQDNTYKSYPVQPSGQPAYVAKAPPTPQQPTVDDYKNFDIVRATQYGVLERCMELIEGGFDVNQVDTENVSLLHWAAINNRTEIVK